MQARITSTPRARATADIAIVAAIAVFAFLPFDATGRIEPWRLASLGVAAVILMFRDRFPLPSLVACVVVLELATFFGRGTPAFVLPVAIGLFAYANRRSRGRTALVALATAVVLVGFAWALTLGSILDPRLILLVVTVIAAAAAGDATRSRRDTITAITERAERAEQALVAEASRQVAEERLRIARDLHDVVAHQMTVINLHAGVASETLRSNPEQAGESLSTIATAARRVLSEIGSLLAVLRTDASRSVSPARFDSLDDLVGEFESLGLMIERRSEGTPIALTGAVDVAAFRVVQEGLTNAQKHGSAGRAALELSFDADSLTITIENPSLGRSPESTGRQQAGHGLVGMRERVEAVHGTLHAEPTALGFRVSATLPTREGATA